MKQFLVILRGAPASGKTTIAKRLRDFDKKIAWLKVDNFKDFFAEDSSVALEFVNGSAIVTLEYLLKQGFSVVMEGVFQNTKAINDAVNLAKIKNVKVVVYQMRCPLQTILTRDKSRVGVKEGCRKPLGDEVITQIYQVLENNPFPGAQTLDTENLSIEQCIETIKFAVKS